MATDLDIAWLAGVFDGEGCIGLYPRIIHGKRSGWDYFVVIANADAPLIRKAAEIVTHLTGKRPYIRSDMTRRGNRRVCYAITVQSRPRIIAWLEAMRPYLVAKGEQADIMLIALKARGHDAHGTNTEVLKYAALQLKAMKEPSQADAEVTLAGLRSLEHRNDKAVTPKNNLPTSPRLPLFPTWDTADDIV
jgi:hypothetical protein